MNAQSVLLMLVVMIIIGYALATAMIEKNITYSLGKVYMVMLMAFVMALAEYLIMHHGAYDPAIISGLAICSGLFWYFNRDQTFIDYSNYCAAMIEHHEMAVVMSQRLLEKKYCLPDDVKQLAENIITTQTSEIAQMQGMIQRGCV